MSSEHPDLVELGRKWIAAWNTRDLEHVLTLYAEDAEMTSDHVVRLGFSVQGSLRGKHNLRAYWSKALRRQRRSALHRDCRLHQPQQSRCSLRESARAEDL